MSNNITKKPRGRPRGFDEQAVLQRACEIFLEDGFEAVSYEQLAADVGLSKPSLYNTFGDKNALFERALANYAQVAQMHLIAGFSGAESFGEGARNFLATAADFYSRTDGPSKGCLLVGTALPACAYPGSTRETLSSFIVALEGRLKETIKTEYAKHATHSGKTPEMLAMHLTSLLFSLAVRARAGLSRRKLRAIAGKLGDLVC